MKIYWSGSFIHYIFTLLQLKIIQKVQITIENDWSSLNTTYLNEIAEISKSNENSSSSDVFEVSIIKSRIQENRKSGHFNTNERRHTATDGDIIQSSIIETPIGNSTKGELKTVDDEMNGNDMIKRYCSINNCKTEVQSFEIKKRDA